MLGNCENVVLSAQINETGLMASSGGRLIDDDKPTQQQPLKCPRCDSSNTKFCYFNNYSLSQPRHFCKACKRYWTKGGTLRNVPVGGGYRRNKRAKRPTPSSCADAASSLPAITPTRHHIDALATNHGNLSFYGLHNDPSYNDLPFSRFNSRTSNVDTVPMSSTGYDHQLQLSALGLSFPTLTMSSDAHDEDHRDVITSSNSFPSNFSLLGSSFSSSSYVAPTSLMASRLDQHQKVRFGDLKETRGIDHYQALLPFEGFRMVRNGEREMVTKEYKFEEGNSAIGNKMEWSLPGQNPIKPDSSFYWNPKSTGTWPDLSNSESSVTPLI